MNLANASGPNFRADANAALAALATLSAGAVAPTPTFANQLWYDTATAYLKKRDNGNTTWQVLFNLDASGNLTFKPGANDRAIDLRNATDQIVARMRADTGGDGRVVAEDRNSALRVQLHGPTTGGKIYLDGDESTGKQVAPVLKLGPFNLTGLSGQTVALPVAGAQELVIGFITTMTDTGSTVVQLGHTGGLTTSGYTTSSAALLAGSVVAVVNSTTSFPFHMGIASNAAMGTMQFVHVGSNQWVQGHSGSFVNRAIAGGGTVILPNSITQLRLFGSTFASGSFSVIVRY